MIMTREMKYAPGSFFKVPVKEVLNEPKLYVLICDEAFRWLVKLIVL